MQMIDLPTSKAQLVLFIINNFNNCINLNTFLFFQCMIVRANIYVLPNLFPILNYNKSVVQADLFKLQCESCRSPVINTDSYASVWVVSLWRDHMISKIKKRKQKEHGHENDIKLLQIRSSCLFWAARTLIWAR